VSAIETLRGSFPESARDIKLNLQVVLGPGALSPEQRWGVALASAVASRNARLQQAVLSDARLEVNEALIEDALAAAALMAMNNVYYRFRHMSGKASYADIPARLRMNRMAKPATSKLNFELFSLAVSAINGCEACVRSHESVLVEGGLSENAVHDAVRIAATIQAAAVALEIGELQATSAAQPASATLAAELFQAG
jgi:alkyl hydroperoxide reductase subunit D